MTPTLPAPRTAAERAALVRSHAEARRDGRVLFTNELTQNVTASDIAYAERVVPLDAPRARKYPSATLSNGSVMEYRKGEADPWVLTNKNSATIRSARITNFLFPDADTAACVALMSAEVVDPVREALVRILTSDDPPLSGKLDAIVALINQHAAPERAP